MVRIAITVFGVANKIESLCDLPIGSKQGIQKMNTCKHSKIIRVHFAVWAGKMGIEHFCPTALSKQ
jgi:hypothetical protein